MAALKSRPIHRFSVVIFTFFILSDCRIHNHFESRVALNLGLGGARDVATAIITLINRLNKTKSAVSIFWMLYFQRIFLSDNLEITTSLYINLVLLLAHLSRRLTGELIVYTGIRRPSVVRPSTFSNDISSEAVRRILSILHI